MDDTGIALVQLDGAKPAGTCTPSPQPSILKQVGAKPAAKGKAKKEESEEEQESEEVTHPKVALVLPSVLSAVHVFAELTPILLSRCCDRFSHPHRGSSVASWPYVLCHDHASCVCDDGGILDVFSTDIYYTCLLLYIPVVMCSKRQ